MTRLYIVEGRHRWDSATSWETQYLFVSESDAQKCMRYLSKLIASMRFRVVSDVVLEELPNYMA